MSVARRAIWTARRAIWNARRAIWNARVLERCDWLGRRGVDDRREAMGLSVAEAVARWCGRQALLLPHLVTWRGFLSG